MSGFANGAMFEGMMRDIEDASQARAHASELGHAYERITNLAEDNAANLAEKYALRKALEQFDPNHPLLKDQNLREAIHRDAIKVYHIQSSDWDDVRNVGSEYKYPYAAPAGSAALAKRVEQLEAENVQNYAEKHALKYALDRIDTDHPLLMPTSENSPLIASLRKAALTAFASSKTYEAVKEVARTLRYPEDPFRAPRQSILESYNGELHALERRVASLRDERQQELAKRLREQALRSGA